MAKEPKIFRITKKFSAEKIYVAADDVVISNQGDLLFRVKAEPSNKFETVRCLARGEWAGFKRMSEKDMLEIERQEQEQAEEEE